ncbi:MAG TPA: FlgD immunoglobulin-like domain containing protein [Candidatus Krumholzibacteria bacterium]|nr:FlgD immunoglobulin-like domain containing protein [Candidatus Krumholzibacteria bacterium]
MRTLTNGSAPIGRALHLLALVMLPFAAHAAQINEIRTDQEGTDNDEFFELAGLPGERLTALTYLVIGDGTGGCGVIEAVVSLDGLAIEADGTLVVSEATSSFVEDVTASLNFENSDNVTHMLVSGFTGTNGQDLDPDDDGDLDTTPWTAIVDAVGLVRTLVIDAEVDEYLYAATHVGPDGTLVPGHVVRCGTVFVIGGGDDGTPGAPNDLSSAPPAALFSTRLLGNRPNPFNPITTIQLTLEREEHVSLTVFDIRGRKVRALVDGVMKPGVHDRIVWDGKDDSGQPVQSGTYVYQLETASGVRESRKMTVLR